MKIYKYTPYNPIESKNTAIALGFFDGVHLAHRDLLKKTKAIAEKENLVFAVFTFPSEDNFKGEEKLYSTEEKLSLMEDIGVDAVIWADFKSVSRIPAEKFVKSSLIGDMHCQAAVAGYDFRFGKDALGNADLLASLFLSQGAKCLIEEEQKIGNEKISTTKIKSLLREGNAEDARRFLGVPYFIKTKVTHGLGLGNKLGFPTVNSNFASFTPPLKKGVYRTAVDISGKLYSGITNVGICPTFGKRELHAETFIIDYSGDLYGTDIRIFFLGYIRDEKQFNSENELILQIKVDKNETINKNGELTWQAIGLNSQQQET